MTPVCAGLVLAQGKRKAGRVVALAGLRRLRPRAAEDGESPPKLPTRSQNARARLRPGDAALAQGRRSASYASSLCAPVRKRQPGSVCRQPLAANQPGSGSGSGARKPEGVAASEQAATRPEAEAEAEKGKRKLKPERAAGLDHSFLFVSPKVRQLAAFRVGWPALRPPPCCHSAKDRPSKGHREATSRVRSGRRPPPARPVERFRFPAGNVVIQP